MSELDIDIDQAFGKCVFGSDDFGGLGYEQAAKSISKSSSFNHLSSDELIFVKRKQGKDPDKTEPKERYSMEEKLEGPPLGEL